MKMGRHGIFGAGHRHVQHADRSGQTIIFMIIALMILSFIVVWNFDLHKILNLKSRTQNAGDAAALGAARWQGITLNLIGDLNIMQAVLLSSGQTGATTQISDLQARLSYVGPGLALIAAQQGAKQNYMHANEDFTEDLGRHANAVLSDYAAIFTEPYEGCWQEYGTILQTVAGQGVAAAPDNAHFYSDYLGGHMLLTLAFYDAIAGRNWCWFKHNAMDLLSDYTDYNYWPALPVFIPTVHPQNSEIFGLGVLPRTTTLPGGEENITLMNNIHSNRHQSDFVISNEIVALQSTWYIYDSHIWTRWEAIALDGEEPFPAIAAVKPEYDYAGADAAIRIELEAERATPGAGSSHITWTAAAKAFGYLDGDEGPMRPDSCSLVLPAFHSVRLIPVDASSAPEGGSYDLKWRKHAEDHLPSYIENGIAGLSLDCYYCRQLMQWEQDSFRSTGLEWLSATDAQGRLLHPCVATGGGGGPHRPTGGRRRGH